MKPAINADQRRYVFRAGGLVWLACLTAAPLASGRPVAPPQRGFEQNAGQYDSDVLFALDQRVFYRHKVQLIAHPPLSVQFVDANPSAPIEAKNPVAFPLNLYLGPDPRRWRENVPHFSTVRYAQIYPGIDAEWNTGRGLPMVRILLAPGADPQQLLLRLEGVEKLNWTAFDNLIVVLVRGLLHDGSTGGISARGHLKITGCRPVRSG